ncbi:MAG: hypothetical protein R3E96_01250 [Planctomycetota bacterium]
MQKGTSALENQARQNASLDDNDKAAIQMALAAVGHEDFATLNRLQRSRAG